MDGVLIEEELGWGCAGIGTSISCNGPASAPVVLGGSEQIKKTYRGMLVEAPSSLREFEARTGFAIPDERLNPNGRRGRAPPSVRRFGHPQRAPLATDLAGRGARYGCLGICVGSGEGVAIVLERP